MSIIFNGWQKLTNFAKQVGISSERIQQATLVTLNLVHQVKNGDKVIKFLANTPVGKSVDCFGLTFKHPFGLAAGVDKNGDYIQSLSSLGFSFIEVGTITPLPQKGTNNYPRIIVDHEKKTIYNSIGIENKGLNYTYDKLQSAKNYFIENRINVKIGLNITFNKENADNSHAIVKDFTHCIDRAYNVVDYFVLNISCPNYPELTNDVLERVLVECKTTQENKTRATNKKVPILIKIAPTLDGDKIDTLLDMFNKLDYEGIIATNSQKSDFRGANSGEPIDLISTETIAAIRIRNKDIPIIASGGCVSWESIKTKLNMNVNLVQIYSGLIFYGLDFLKRSIQNHKEM